MVIIDSVSIAIARTHWMRPLPKIVDAHVV